MSKFPLSKPGTASAPASMTPGKPAASAAAAPKPGSAGKPPGAGPAKAVHIVEAEGTHDKKLKKVLTTQLEQLKKITEFDTWVDNEMEKLAKGKSAEIDFDDWDAAKPSERTKLIESKLAALAVPDSPARKKFVDEYNKRALVVQALVHDPALKRTHSGSKLT